MPLMKKGLLAELTKRLRTIGATPTDPGSSVQSVTMVVNLISTLCRGSDAAAKVSVYLYCT